MDQMTTEQRKEMLLQQLDLSGLEGWTGANCMSANAVLIKYHDIFSLQTRKLGGTSLMKHEIQVVDDEPSKERLQRLQSPMVEEVRAHVKEMLEVGAIHPSKSPWCNAVVLVRKKDGGLCFCIDFCKLNARTKKDSLSITPHTGGPGESHRGWVFILSGLESRFLADCHVQSIEAVYSLHSREPRIFLSVNICPSGCVILL